VAVTSTGASVTGLLEGSTNYTGFKNRIINGAMVIDQRNAGASVTPNISGGGTFTVDRWFAQVSQNSKLTAQQNAGSVTPPAGFSNYIGFTSSSAYSILSSDYFSLRQNIEGFNIADLGWGTANAQPITVSFKVYSSLTGTFGATIQGNYTAGTTRTYPFTYSIPVANTWTTISVTIAGDTTGTWLINNGTGISLAFGLGVGSTFSATAGSWQVGNFISATGAVSVVGTSGATFYITGVQLEKGSTATSFDYRPYGTELALCQRYYWQTSVISGQVLFDVYSPIIGGQFKGLSIASMFVEPRATPTITVPVQTAVNISGTPAFVYVGGAIQCASASTAVGRAVIITNAGFITATGMEL
jgi:hypothetical protein